MSRGRRLLLLLSACVAAGGLAGYLMRCASDLTRVAGTHADLLPGLPGQAPRPKQPVGRTCPPHDSREGRLIDQMIAHPGDFPPGRLAELAATDPDPAVRGMAARQIGVRLAGSRDAAVAATLEKALALEKDPIVHGALKGALRDLASPR